MGEDDAYEVNDEDMTMVAYEVDLVLVQVVVAICFQLEDCV